MQQLGIPITPSTGEQDAKGIDFFIFEQCTPVDVTCNSTPQRISDKLTRGNSTILFIPQFPKQQSIKQFRGRENILDYFLAGELTPERYLQLMLTINTEFKEILFESLKNKYYHHKDLRIKKVKNKDIVKLDKTLRYLSRISEGLQ